MRCTRMPSFSALLKKKKKVMMMMTNGGRKERQDRKRVKSQTIKLKKKKGVRKSEEICGQGHPTHTIVVPLEVHMKREQCRAVVHSKEDGGPPEEAHHLRHVVPQPPLPGREPEGGIRRCGMLVLHDLLDLLQEEARAPVQAESLHQLITQRHVRRSRGSNRPRPDHSQNLQTQ